jgi:hypothetical protein
MRMIRGLAAAAALALTLVAPAAANAGQIKAGAAVVDASWHVGASAGQYASGRQDSTEFDPNVHQFKNAPSYGVQARLQARAVVVQEADGTKVAVVKNDNYIPQDLLWRRTKQLVEARTGITNVVMSVTHDHSSPYYTSTGAGAWTFQDVFDVRMYNYLADRMATAIELANKRLVPVRVGAAVRQVAQTNRNAVGPAKGDDGTPAGFPDSYTDQDITVVRFDALDGKPVATLVNFAQHPESLSGNDLISADYLGPLQRMVDRETGGVTVWTQGAVGNTELERNSYHSIHDRLFFDHREYGQAEYNARILSDHILAAWREIGGGGGRVPFFSDGPVKFDDRWFPGPATHPYPAVSNCRTNTLTTNPFDPHVPIAGLPDCAGPSAAFGEFGQPYPDTPQNPGPTADDLRKAGIPVPDNYGAPSYGALEEDLDVHLQAFRIGDILFTVCSCEQWADQSKNIRTRTDREIANEWLGFDWTTYRGLTGLQEPCTPVGNDQYSCLDPTTECQLIGPGLSNTCRTGDPAKWNSRVTITKAQYELMQAQVRNPANGWNSRDYVQYAESEPGDPKQIKGNYTQDDDARSAQFGYRLTVPIGMANDYNGYIATYREYQRGDHYRKALTGWGPHSSDYMATRMVKMGRHLNGAPDVDKLADGSPDPDFEADTALAPKVAADMAHNDARAQALGEGGNAAIQAYEAKLPPAKGKAEAIEQPKDIERFGAALFTFNGGSNYDDNPEVVVQRRSAATGRTSPTARARSRPRSSSPASATSPPTSRASSCGSGRRTSRPSSRATTSAARGRRRRAPTASWPPASGARAAAPAPMSSSPTGSSPGSSWSAHGAA